MIQGSMLSLRLGWAALAASIFVGSISPGSFAQSSRPGNIPGASRYGNVQDFDVRLDSPQPGFFSSGTQNFFPKNFQKRRQDYEPSRTTPANVIDDNYPVGPGDHFLISFWGRIEDSLIIEVDNDSNLFIPRIGVIKAENKRYRPLVKEITDFLKDRLKNVEFSISLFKPRQFQVYVLGAVMTPGPVNTTAQSRASQLIAGAGGVAARGSRQYIEIRRKDEVIPFNLLKYETQGVLDANPFVTEYDTLFVPNLSEFITVSGAVVSPGTFEIRETNKLAEIIQELGGISVYADRRTPMRLSRLLPTGERVMQNIVWAASQRVEESDLVLEQTELKHGDEIFVPSTQLLIPQEKTGVFITGEVKTPGPQPFQLSSSIEEYIGLAGGLTNRANFANAVVYKSSGKTERVRPRMIVEPGDTIYIPETTFKFWQDHVQILTTFISLATSIIVLSGR